MKRTAKHRSPFLVFLVVRGIHLVNEHEQLNLGALFDELRKTFFVIGFFILETDYVLEAFFCFFHIGSPLCEVIIA